MSSQQSHAGNGNRASQSGLENLGIRHVNDACFNLGAAQLLERAIQRREGHLSSNGSLVVRTGQFTGRSPKDKFIVRDEITDSTVQWGAVNQPMSEAHFDRLYSRMQTFWHGRDVFVQDCFVGADPAYTLPLRVISQYAWHSLFARQLFIHPSLREGEEHRPEFTILFAPDFQADPAEEGTNSETCIVINFKKKVVLICGTQYAGEMKKSAFTIMNYLLPERGVFPMHCSANTRRGSGDVALFLRAFGHRQDHAFRRSRAPVDRRRRAWLERPRGLQFRRRLLCQVHPAVAGAGAADLERHPFRHGAGKRGHGRRSRGCWISTPRKLRRIRARPIRWSSSRTRVIPSVGGHPANVIFLTADAFGVLPPISRLTPEQAMYHFLSGYTAKVAGTERGLGKEPQATFSACFGAPFLPRPASVYAALLGERLRRYGSACWLVNTGWTGGPYRRGRAHEAGLYARHAECRSFRRASRRGHGAGPGIQTGRSVGLPRCAGRIPGRPRDVGGQNRVRQSRARPEQPL